ncbi:MULTISPECIES: DUF1064 domain-containing protein [unclassified Paenibacillus]|uniref:DUF1064 domain-containing protein n=1 Tax=Paenibacillus provencensis TaxID=441151 RepID=A0ABW3PPZ2_9BACL|nr:MULTISPECIES: DUF1064 domain-containing protein [unclassified Paenibacillus]MCM3130966.1 DUF1064 domain-containing protein [Paenibacillus sp. MER 78]SDX05155.1 Protein of unknown function [Paenibacillus sp. PDC88]
MIRKTNKYGAKQTIIDNITFDSKMEAQRYAHLCMLQRAGLISELENHPEFVLIEPFTKLGKKKRGHKYKADFMYLDEHGQRIVEDVKGFVARDFPLRRTLFDSKYPDLLLKVVKNTNGIWEEK